MKIAGIALGAAALLLSGTANAAPFLFTLTGADVNTTFTLDSKPTPDLSASNGFVIYDVVGSYNVYDYSTDVADIEFYTSGNGGGIGIYDYFGLDAYLTLTDGAQLFSGSTTAPTLLAGTYSLYDYVTDSTLSLRISAVATPGAVPEPASWAMMIAGFGLVGGTLRRRMATTKVSFA